MQRIRPSKFLYLCLTLTASPIGTIDAADVMEDDGQSEYRESAQPGDPQHVTGKITEIVNAGGITYVEVNTGSEKVWAAGLVDESLSAGNTISFSAAMPMQNFHSKSLNRDFAVIYFATEFMMGNQTPNTVTPSGRANKPQTIHPTIARTFRTPEEVATGSLLPDTSLDGLNTENRSLADYKGMPLMINVWASWCGPCRAEMGSLERLAQRYNGKEFHIIGISTDDYRDKAAAFIDQTEVSFENFIDHELLMENMLGASTIPLTVLIDADGRVLQKVRGSREWDSPEIVKAIGDVFRIELM
jgi:thiol-disulfide isomerase/thioredoxin